MRFVIGSGGFIGEVSIIDGTLTDLYVHPLRRGKGWGHKLMRKAVKWADKGGLRLKLRVHPFGKQTVRSARKIAPREGLINLYKQYGFRRVNGAWMIRNPLLSK